VPNKRRPGTRWEKPAPALGLRCPRPQRAWGARAGWMEHPHIAVRDRGVTGCRHAHVNQDTPGCRPPSTGSASVDRPRGPGFPWGDCPQCRAVFSSHSGKDEANAPPAAIHRHVAAVRGAARCCGLTRDRRAAVWRNWLVLAFSLGVLGRIHHRSPCLAGNGRRLGTDLAHATRRGQPGSPVTTAGRRPRPRPGHDLRGSKLTINRGQRAHAIRVPATGHWLWGWSEASDSNPDSSMSRRVGESSATIVFA
jgi:hypothetical protein